MSVEIEKEFFFSIILGGAVKGNRYKNRPPGLHTVKFTKINLTFFLAGK